MRRASALELANHAIALGRRGVNGYEIVIVKIYAPRTNFAKQAQQFPGSKDGTHRLSERITSDVAHSPKAERKLVFGFWLKSIQGHVPLSTLQK
jgi:hypothetical protein